jgi:hypothetical protein
VEAMVGVAPVIFQIWTAVPELDEGPVSHQAMPDARCRLPARTVRSAREG